MIAVTMQHLVEIHTTRDLAYVAGLVSTASLVLSAIKDPISSHIPFIQTAITTERHLIATIPARRITSGEEVATVLQSIDDPKPTDLMLVGGNDEASGIFEDSLGLLHYLLEHKYVRGRNLYFAAHPEGTIESGPDVLLGAMKEKEELCRQFGISCVFVSQICIVPSVYAAWIDAVRSAGIISPIVCGISTSCTQSQLVDRFRFCFTVRKARMIESARSADMLPGDFSPASYVQKLQQTVDLNKSGISGFYWCCFDTMNRVEDDVLQIEQLIRA